MTTKDIRNIDGLSPKDIAQLRDKLLSRTIVRGNCWEWQGAKNLKGYGSISVGGVVILVHRLSYRVHHGRLGDNLVCHRCDNPKCVNPAHLFLGTATDNIHDMYHKGRAAPSPSTKITADDARSNREKYIPRKYGTTRLAKEYGISCGHVYAILRGEFWREAGGPILGNRG